MTVEALKSTVHTNNTVNIDQTANGYEVIVYVQSKRWTITPKTYKSLNAARKWALRVLDTPNSWL